MRSAVIVRGDVGHCNPDGIGGGDRQGSAGRRRGVDGARKRCRDGVDARQSGSRGGGSVRRAVDARVDRCVIPQTTGLGHHGDRLRRTVDILHHVEAADIEKNRRHSLLNRQIGVCGLARKASVTSGHHNRVSSHACGRRGGVAHSPAARTEQRIGNGDGWDRRSIAHGVARRLRRAVVGHCLVCDGDRTDGELCARGPDDVHTRVGCGTT